MGRINGADAMYLLGELRGEFRAIRADVSDLKDEVHEVRRDVANLRENRRSLTLWGLPPWTIIRFIAAAGFTLAAMAMRVDLGILKSVLALAR